ncbi:glycosyltransferase family 2 protein [Belnapia sp. F-4-1]|uniref:glycosyltransferase family 2 protein n=1 Tax=Belnapia sp. F-4-1 TaxID=1545443 RepID=UPI0005B7730A|nr:glycosyltransferase family 2 protein [Belnapia sp. F-4-1]
MKLSIIATLYRSARDLAEFHRRAMRAAEALTSDIEMILVDDGSPDDSLDIALRLQRDDPRIVVAELARNFGHHRAMMTGLAYATGDLVLLIDSDLEEPPELLAIFHERLVAGNWDVVYGVQADRRGGFIQRVTGEAFFKMTELLSDHPLPRNVITARLMRRAYVDALVAHRDRSFLIAHLWSIAGFRQTAMEVTKLSLSPTTYSLCRRVEMGIQHVTTTSTKILYLIFYAGSGISGVALALMLFFLIRYLRQGVGVGGWTSLFLSLWFFGGVIIQILGILGLYIANIYQEVKERPYTHLRRLHGGGQGGEG